MRIEGTRASHNITIKIGRRTGSILIDVQHFE